MLNLWGAEAVRAAQKIAVGESRLGIPLAHRPRRAAWAQDHIPHSARRSLRFRSRRSGRRRRGRRRRRRRGTASRWFLRRCSTSRAIRAGAAPARAPAKTLMSRPNSHEAKLRGFQGEDLSDPDAVAATAKHFRRLWRGRSPGATTPRADVSERTLHEVYLPPFAAAVAAGCAAIMPGFMDLAGVPMTAHQALLSRLAARRAGISRASSSAITMRSRNCCAMASPQIFARPPRWRLKRASIST